MEFVAFRHLHVKLGRCHMSRKVRIRVQGDLFTFPPELIMSRPPGQLYQFRLLLQWGNLQLC